MEKHTAHCKLSLVRGLIATGKVRATKSAFDGAVLVGISTLAEMCEVVNGLTQADFYKSMTTHNDHRVWQDVYRGRSKDGFMLYVKLTVVDDLLIVSFKEL